MGNEKTERKGVIEGGSRVTRELMRSPRFRQTLRILLRELDPENTPLLVRALTQEDPELFLSLLGSLPAMANIGIEGAHELLRQLHEVPHGTFIAFIPELIEGVEAEKLGELSGMLLALSLSVVMADNDELNRAHRQFKDDFTQGLSSALRKHQVDSSQVIDLALDRCSSIAARWGDQAAKKDSPAQKNIQKLARGLLDVAKENPEFIANVIQPIATAWREATGMQPAERSGDDEQ